MRVLLARPGKGTSGSASVAGSALVSGAVIGTTLNCMHLSGGCRIGGVEVLLRLAAAEGLVRSRRSAG